MLEIFANSHKNLIYYNNLFVIDHARRFTDIAL